MPFHTWDQLVFLLLSEYSVVRTIPHRFISTYLYAIMTNGKYTSLSVRNSFTYKLSMVARIFLKLSPISPDRGGMGCMCFLYVQQFTHLWRVCFQNWAPRSECIKIWTSNRVTSSLRISLQLFCFDVSHCNEFRLLSKILRYTCIFSPFLLLVIHEWSSLLLAPLIMRLQQILWVLS